MSESVVVVTPDAPPEPVVDTTPPVVVVAAPEPGTELAQTVGRLEAENKELRERLEQTERSAESAQITADLALSAPPVVIEEVEPVVEEHHEEPDEPPNNKHKWFQSMDELRS